MTRKVWIAALGALVVAAALAAALVAVVSREQAPLERFATLRGPDVVRPPAREGAPNLVLVVGCTVRADQTSPYGGPATTTPFLASLAADGARFADPVSAAPWTRAASVALLTGHHAVSVGMADPASQRDERRLPEETVTLAEHLRAGGYRTLGLTTNPNLNAVYGFDQGFDAWRQLARLWREEGTKVSGRHAVPEALALLDEVADDRPFFLFVLLVDAHAPHAATPEELAVQADPGVPAEVVAYRAALRRFDDAVASLARGLEQRGHGADTLFVVANDHGDGLGWPEHHGRSHGRYLAPSAVGGVWVLRGPGVPAGEVIGGVASQIDLAPTLAGLVGWPGLPAEGRDLSAVVRSGGVTGEPAAFTDTWFQDADRAAVYTDDVACQRAFDEQDSVLFRDGCFDRRSDPTHAHPRASPAHDALLARWRETHVQRPGVPVTTDPDLDRQLRELGYLDP